MSNIPTDLKDMLAPLREYEPSKLRMPDMHSSAVLIPILTDGGDHRLLFTQRSQSLRHHPGQISFPGGRVEPGERPWLAALREAEEEIGLPADAVRPFGRLDDFYSPRGFHIRCFVAVVKPFDLRLNPAEVDAIIEVDVNELFDPDVHEIKPWKGHQVHYFNFRNGLVWGITGHMVYRLREVLHDPSTLDSVTL